MPRSPVELVIVSLRPAAQTRSYSRGLLKSGARGRHVSKPTKRWTTLILAMGLCYAIDGLAASAGPPQAGNPVVGQSFRDCEAYCPEMVSLPPGKFTMGSPLSQVGRGSDESPQRVVAIAYTLAVGKYPVTRGEFAAFVEDTGRKLGPCEHWDGRAFRLEEGIYWSNTFRQTGRHPAVCVNWDDSQAYVQWLSRKTGKRYRLLSEAEWEYAARAGTTTAWYWGNSEVGQCRYANGADLSAKAQGVIAPDFIGCDDNYAHTSPVGSFRPNEFGLYDMAGNVGEWVEDCYQDSYREAPTDGSAVETCMPKFHKARVMRGGAWNAIPAWLRSASRDVEEPSLRSDSFGFRVARTEKP
jgi:formylglycine-generating enzyme required for sulfatase activity